MKLILCSFKIDEEAKFTLENIIKHFKNSIHKEEIEIGICNLDSFQPVENNYLLIFDSYIPDGNYLKIWNTHSLSFLKKKPEKKKEVVPVLTEISNFIKSKDKKLLIEKNSIKLGIGGEIALDKEEIDYLLKIKDLVGGGDILIEKGDLKIRIKDGKL